MSLTDIKIVFVHWNPCVRVLKIAAALHSKGYHIDLICGKLTSQPRLSEYVDKIFYYDEDDSKLARIFQENRWDLIHCHNEPNKPTTIALENAKGAPVIFDCHDFSGLRATLDKEQAEIERRCFEETQGVIHVSEGMLQAAAERYASAKAMVLPSYPLLFDFERRRLPKLSGNHMVYQGGLLDAGIVPYEYRDYHPYFEMLAKAGITVHAYAASFNLRVLKTYLKLAEDFDNFILYEPLPYKKLLETMSQYQWGLAGFNTRDITDKNRIRFLNNALPNKLFDYIFSGVCPVAINNKTAGSWLEENEIGYYARNDEELLDIVLNRPTIPALEDISFISMEKNIELLETFYTAILSGAS
ncbi:MAG: glycosyltransferase [Desulfomicrobium sp.]